MKVLDCLSKHYIHMHIETVLHAIWEEASRKSQPLAGKLGLGTCPPFWWSCGLLLESSGSLPVVTSAKWEQSKEVVFSIKLKSAV